MAVANAVLEVGKAVLDGVQHRHHHRHLPVHHPGPDLDSCGPWAIILGGAPP